MNTVERESKEILQYLRSFLKWLWIAAVTGTAGGLVGSAFHLSVSWAAGFRAAHPWLLWLLPAAGCLIGLVYHLFKTENKNTNTIIDSIHFGDRVPLSLLPTIYLATVITHLFGGSAGREGAALQIGGSLGNYAGRIFRLDDKDRRVATLSGMSAVFSALFGTPLTATVFALEVISVGVIYYSALVPCLAASLIALQISVFFGIAPTRFLVTVYPVHAVMVMKVAVLAVGCAVVSILFCLAMHGTEHLLVKKIPNDFVRVLAGGAVIVALTLLLGTNDYNGAGMEVITRAIEKGSARPDAFFWKLLFTALTLGTGYKGGEVVPCFFVGATFGCVLGSLLGIPAGFAAAIGLVAVFCGAVNCPLASILLSVELFGSTELVYFALACGIAYMLSGYFGLYSSQKILYSKLKAEFINIHAK
ncbi:MAG: chloride channel protein [Oscillospiraceae bacterium]|nr:chloride channel protein [Oscillospiraceae bacterium]